MTLTIGLTGGIGSGKSTVAGLFSALGVPIFDTDTISRELVLPGTPALNEIVEQFGRQVLNDTGELNRAELKKRIFENDSARQQLENILHPKIRSHLAGRIKSCSAPYCIAAIPLLIEKNWQNMVDRILVVDLPRQTQIQRARARDNISENLVLQIMQSQTDRDARLAAADDVIDNAGDRASLANQVNELHEKYNLLAAKR